MAEPSNPAAVTHVEVDLESVADSAYDDIQSYATSLNSSIQDYPLEHGRRYHKYREGSYNFPNDEREQDRLDIIHALFTVAIGGKLHLCPKPPSPSRILDIGTGTGIWAIDAGDLYPDAEVIGNDFSAIQPKWVPPNVSFEVDDVESEWPARPPFDLIHSRYMSGSIQNWPEFIKRCYEQTKVGGYSEFQDLDIHHYSEDNSINEGNKVFEFTNYIIEACEKMGRTTTPGPRLKGWLEDAGFKNVCEEVFKIPFGMWPKDQRMKQMGALNFLQFSEGIEAFSIGLFTRVLEWSPEQVQLYLAEVREDMKKKDVHMMFNYYVVWGQRTE